MAAFGSHDFGAQLSKPCQRAVSDLVRFNHHVPLRQTLSRTPDKDQLFCSTIASRHKWFRATCSRHIVRSFEGLHLHPRWSTPRGKASSKIRRVSWFWVVFFYRLWKVSISSKAKFKTNPPWAFISLDDGGQVSHLQISIVRILVSNHPDAILLSR